jgi:lysophospholipase L1-like esterase
VRLQASSSLDLNSFGSTQFAWQNDGMAARLADQYQRKLDVVTRGFGGYTARNIRYTLPHIFTSAANIQLAIVWLGANDLVFGRSVDEYVADIRAIAEAFFETRTAHPNTRMLPCLMLVSPPPRLGVPVDRSRAYNQALVTLTAEIWERFEHRVGVTEIHDNMIVEVERSFPGSYEEQLRHFLPDGVHPNGAGYRVRRPSYLAAI